MEEKEKPKSGKIYSYARSNLKISVRTGAYRYT
jgi:hypothetical protein